MTADALRGLPALPQEQIKADTFVTAQSPKIKRGAFYAELAEKGVSNKSYDIYNKNLDSVQAWAIQGFFGAVLAAIIITVPLAFGTSGFSPDVPAIAYKILIPAVYGAPLLIAAVGLTVYAVYTVKQQLHQREEMDLAKVKEELDNTAHQYDTEIAEQYRLRDFHEKEYNAAIVSRDALTLKIDDLEKLTKQKEPLLENLKEAKNRIEAVINSNPDSRNEKQNASLAEDFEKTKLDLEQHETEDLRLSEELKAAKLELTQIEQKVTDHQERYLAAVDHLTHLEHYRARLLQPEAEVPKEEVKE